MIEISNLSMRYGDLLALDGLDLVIPRGELFAFLGPNAAGKTTTIKLLTGLIEPTSGSARICGYDIQKEPLEAKRRIGYIPDVAEFYDKLTPVEFMTFIAELFQVPHEAAKTRTPELMERFSLVPYARQRIENLSHGTRQRLAFASAFLHEPEVVIVDEPMVGLDPKNARVVTSPRNWPTVSGSSITANCSPSARSRRSARRPEGGLMNRSRNSFSISPAAKKRLRVERAHFEANSKRIGAPCAATSTSRIAPPGFRLVRRTKASAGEPVDSQMLPSKVRADFPATGPSPSLAENLPPRTRTAVAGRFLSSGRKTRVPQLTGLPSRIASPETAARGWAGA
jgi:ABC-2 type transport system ATP-binding protein